MPDGAALHDDLVEMLEVTREAEREIFALLEPATRDAPARIGEWSAKDVLAHLAAWRSVEADRLRSGQRDRPMGELAEGAPASEDDANARIHAERRDWSWQRVMADAEASIDALAAAIRATPAARLRESEHLVTGIGANGANHALVHLRDVAGLAGDERPARAFAARVESILRRGRIPDRDVGVMLYNIACNDALAGRLDDARRLLTDALGRRPDLLAWALEDGDLVSLREELPGLAGA